MPIVSKRNVTRFSFAALLLMPLLAACASSPREAYQIPPPAPGSYFTVRVESGDSVSALAYRYQVGEDDVLALNDLYDRNALPKGERIRIPAYGRLRDPRRGETTVARARSADDNRDEYKGRIDTAPLYDPSRPVLRPAPRQQVTARNLEPARAGEPVPVPRPKPEQQRDDNQLAAAVPPPIQPAQSSWFGSFFEPDPPPKPAAAGAQRLMWPVNGRVLSNFGQSRTGERNDGINISAPLGAPIRSADAGTVSYVGNELKGYGNLVLVRHDNGNVTAYAHAQSVTVSKGERVSRGQVIAYAGETGDVTQPQVHFELRVGTKPVDPRPYLIASN